MVELGKCYSYKIIYNNNLGNGIGKINGFVIFVKGVIVGEVVTVKIVSLKKKYAIGQLIHIIEKSKDRVTIECPYYEQCGGCSFCHMSYNLENSIKKEYVSKTLGINCDYYYDEDKYYRNKVVFHVSNNKIGFYKENSNDLIEIYECLLVSKGINDIYKLIMKMNLNNITEIMIRESTNHDILVDFYGKPKNNDINVLFDNKKVVSIYVNDELYYGDNYLVSGIDRFKYSIYPKSFFQVNYAMMKKLYDIVLNYADSGDKLLDLYCGTGTIGIYSSNRFNSVVGVEIISDAIRNANINKIINNIHNISFINSDVNYIDSNYYDVVIVDPPRNGLNESIIATLLKINSKKIIYVSCNVNTLKRDLDKLSEAYIVKKVSALNMFPRTKHVECACLLHQKYANK